MPSFSNGKKEEPQPGRPIIRHEIIKETKTTESKEVDIDAIAKAVAEAIGKMPIKTVYKSGNGEEYEDDFSTDASLDKLADSMTVQRGKSDANFEDLGGIKETKKDRKEVDKTIDLLKGLDN